jgi:hypothetical protein
MCSIAIRGRRRLSHRPQRSNRDCVYLLTARSLLWRDIPPHTHPPAVPIASSPSSFTSPAGERTLGYRNMTEINNMTSDMTYSEVAMSPELNKMDDMYAATRVRKARISPAAKESEARHRQLLTPTPESERRSVQSSLMLGLPATTRLAALSLRASPPFGIPL